MDGGLGTNSPLRPERIETRSATPRGETLRFTERLLSASHWARAPFPTVSPCRPVTWVPLSLSHRSGDQTSTRFGHSPRTRHGEGEELGFNLGLRSGGVQPQRPTSLLHPEDTVSRAVQVFKDSRSPPLPQEAAWPWCAVLCGAGVPESPCPTRQGRLLLCLQR